MSELEQEQETEESPAEDVSEPVEKPVAPPDTEAKARRMGWVPKEEFRGDHARWVDAEAFVRRGDEEVPIMRERMAALHKRLETTDAELRRMVRETRGLSEAAYQKAREDLKAEQLRAVSNADPDAYSAADARLSKLDAARKVEPDPEPQQTPDPAFAAWRSRNRWYDTDPRLQNVAVGLYSAISQEWGRDANTLDEDRLAAVEAEVKKLYPDRFPASNGNGPAQVKRPNGVSAVEGGGIASRKVGKTYADLPADAKAACDRFVNQKLLTKEDYVKEYFS